MSEQAAFRGLLALLIALIAAVYAIGLRHDNAAAGTSVREPKRDPYANLDWRAAPMAVPDQSFKAPDGSDARLAGFRGRAVLVNLWASWCAPCVAELPALSRLSKDLAGADFAVVTVSLDRSADEGRQWLADNHLTNLPAYHDPQGRLFDALKAPGLPISLFIGADGREYGRIAGPVPWDEPKARDLVARLRGLKSP